MKHLLAALAVLVGGNVAVRAHFVWIVPDQQGKSAQVVFSETPTPDNPALLAKIARTQVSLRYPGSKGDIALNLKKDKEMLGVELPGKGARLVGGVCQFGVLQKGDSDPFLLNYYARAVVSAGAGHELAASPWRRLPLDIVRAGGKFQVLWEGKPLADAEVVYSAPGDESPAKTTTDKSGRFDLGSFQGGLCGIRTKYVETKQGEFEGKKYKEIRHVAALVIQVDGDGDKKPAGVKADPQATKLLADARAARANWSKFPGFTADLEVNFDGKVKRGKVAVDARGKVVFDDRYKLGAEPEAWAKRQLGSIVAHRNDDSASLDTPCAFADKDVDHPLGRAITVLNDELHSSYRIRDQQIIVVNRDMKGMRFTITVLENRTNKEGKFLPATYVVNYWDTKTSDLLRSEAHSQSWTRLGAFDLPVNATVITASKNLSTRRLTLSNHQLSK